MIKKIFGIFLSSFISLLILTNVGFAATAKENLDKSLKKAGGAAFGTDLPTDALPRMIGSIIQVILGILGVVAFLLVIYAGYLYLTARENEKQVESAKSILKNAVIGLIIISSAYAISRFIIDKVIEGSLAG